MIPQLRITLVSTIDVEALKAATQRGGENAMPAVAEALREHVDSCFEREGDPWGNAWEPLAPATITERARKNKSGKILQRDGVLRRSVFAEPTAVEPGVTRAFVSAGGPAAAYASAQQFGTEDIPARPFMPLRGDAVDLPPDLKTEIAETIKDAIRAELQAAREADR